MQTLTGLPLHDATLESVSLDWAQGICVFVLEPAASQRSALVFSAVESVTLPRSAPWGRSVSVNTAREIDTGTFEIEMQSGDVLRVVAAAWTFNVLDESSNPSFPRTAARPLN